MLPFFFPMAAIGNNEQSGVPMLLQFAERYQQREQILEEKVPPKSPKMRIPAKKNDPKSAKDTALILRFEEAQRKLVQHEQVIASLRQQIGQLTKVKQEKRPNPEFDFSSVSLMFSKLRQAMAITPDELHAKSLVAQAQQTYLEVQKTSNEIAKERAETQRKFAKINQELTVADERYKEVNEKLREKEQVEERLGSEIVKLRAREKLYITSETLESATARQSYAAGVALGKDINMLEHERSGWGVDVDRNALFTGVTDAFLGQYKLTPKELDEAFSESENIIAIAREKSMKLTQKTDDDFVRNFIQRKGVQQASSGFWYYINYIGDGDIKGNAVVDIMVKESLTNGTVINDMESNNKILSLPLNDYPPLFQEALSLLKNHGSITLVVPPSLAYGELGNLPEIPPHATMVYDVRIDNVKESVVE